MRLWRHKNGRYYVLYGLGLKRRISTGETDRRKAEAELARIRSGSLEPAIGRPTVQAIVEGYQADKLPVLRSPGSLKHCVAGLVRHLGDLEPDHLTPTTLKR